MAARRALARNKRRTFASSSSDGIESLARKWVPPALVVVGGLALLLPKSRGAQKTPEEQIAMKMNWDTFTVRSLRMNDDDDDDDDEEEEEDDE